MVRPNDPPPFALTETHHRETLTFYMGEAERLQTILTGIDASLGQRRTEAARADLEAYRVKTLTRLDAAHNHIDNARAGIAKAHGVTPPQPAPLSPDVLLAKAIAHVSALEEDRAAGNDARELEEVAARAATLAKRQAKAQAIVEKTRAARDQTREQDRSDD